MRLILAIALRLRVGLARVLFKLAILVSNTAAKLMPKKAMTRDGVGA